jgi:hypothetical protein
LKPASDLASFAITTKSEEWKKEITVGTVIQYTQRSNDDRHQRWDRIERAELCEQYRALKVHGISQRQAAKVLEAPRSTLQAWRAY